MKTRIGYALDKAANGGELDYSPYKVAIDIMCQSHRYCQSVIFRFVKAYIKLNAYRYKSERTRWFDGRNEYVGKVCNDICEQVDEMKIFSMDEENIAENGKKYGELNTSVNYFDV